MASLGQPVSLRCRAPPGIHHPATLRTDGCGSVRYAVMMACAASSLRSTLGPRRPAACLRTPRLLSCNKARITSGITSSSPGLQAPSLQRSQASACIAQERTPGLGCWMLAFSSGSASSSMKWSRIRQQAIRTAGSGCLSPLRTAFVPAFFSDRRCLIAAGRR